MNKDENEFNNCKKINSINESHNNGFEVIDLNKPDIKKISLLKKESATVKKDEKIAICYDNQEKAIPIKSPIYGWVYKYLAEDKKIILEICPHETFYYNCCIKCGFMKNKEYDLQNKDRFSFNEFSYSKGKAESIEKQQIETYLKQQKLIILLDLDNTIIHSYSSPSPLIRIPDAEIKKLLDLYKIYFAKVPIKNQLNRNENILVKFRPFLKTFLKNIQNKYEIYIYTHGTKEYATGIIQYINLNFEPNSLSTRRMIYRVLDDNGNPKIKSIKEVFPTQEKMILIIDDRINVWEQSGGNLICIYPYKFFNENILINNNQSDKKKDINKEHYLKNEYDNVLFCITNLLLCIHRKFYEFYSKYNIQKDIQLIVDDILFSIFNGKKFYYHLNYYNYPDLQKKKKKEKKEQESKEETKDNNNEINNNETNNQTPIKTDNINNNEIQKNIEIENNNNNINLKNETSNNNEININNEKNTEVKTEANTKKEKIRNLEEENRKKAELKNNIEKLGGTLIEDEKDKFDSDLFLTDFYDEKDPVILSIEEYNSKNNSNKIPILHCHYIEICLMYFFEVSIDEFILSPKLKIIRHLDLNQIFTKNKVNIINFYENDDFVDEN